MDLCNHRNSEKLKKKLYFSYTWYVYIFMELILNGEENLIMNIDK